MTSRERLETALRHGVPDRTPMFEYVLLSPLADAFLGRPYGGDPGHWPGLVAELGWEATVRREAADRVELARRLGHDLIYAVPNPGPSRPSVAASPPSPPSPDDPVERMALRNAASRGWAPRPPDDNLLIYRLLREEMTRQGVDLPLLAPAYAHGVWTDTDLMETMALAPDVAAEHFALATRGSLAWTERYLELGIELIGVGGDFAGNRQIISPAMYRRYIAPEVRRVAQRIHAGGARAVNASDGDLWPVLEDFLFGCEVDAYLEIDRGAGMEMDRLMTVCRGRVSLFGNMDCGNLLSFGDEPTIRAETLACLEAGMGGGHVFCASNAITSSVPMASYLAMVGAYRERFGLPALTPPE